jgi:hypothetical protein
MVIGTGGVLSKTEARFTTKETTAGQRETLIPADSMDQKANNESFKGVRKEKS